MGRWYHFAIKKTFHENENETTTKKYIRVNSV